VDERRGSFRGDKPKLVALDHSAEVHTEERLHTQVVKVVLHTGLDGRIAEFTHNFLTVGAGTVSKPVVSVMRSLQPIGYLVVVETQRQTIEIGVYEAVIAGLLAQRKELLVTVHLQTDRVEVVRVERSSLLLGKHGVRVLDSVQPGHLRKRREARHQCDDGS